MKKYKVAFIQYDKVEPSSGIGNVCKQFNVQLNKFGDIELFPLAPPITYFKLCPTIIKVINKIVFALWYRSVMPFQVLINKADIYIELNMVNPPFLLKNVSFLIYDLAFVRYPEVVTKRNYIKRMRLLGRIPKYKFNHMVISNATKFDLVKHTNMNQDNFSVCYLASMFETISKYKMELVGYDGYFLFVGTIEPRKNIIEIVKAFYTFINQTKANYKLILIGKMGWLMDDLVDVIESDPEKRELIDLVGYVDDAALSQWYGGAKALLFPSLYEGFGLPILEAMVHSTPVITCNNSSLTEVGGDAVLYTEPDYLSIAEAMKRIWEDPLLVKKLRDKGKEQLRNFSWQKFGKCVHDSILNNLKK